MIRFLLALALLASGGCAPAGCDGPALAFRTPTGPNHYVAPGDMASGGGGGLSLLQITSFNTTDASTTRTFTPASNLTSASTLMLLLRQESTVSGVSDGTNGSWTQSVSNTGGGQYLYAYTLKNNSSTGKPTITITVGDFYKDVGGSFVEIGGASTTAPVEATANGTNGTADYYGGSVTVAGSAYVFGWWTTNNADLTDPPYGITQDAGWSKSMWTGRWVQLGTVYKLVTAGTYNPHATANSGNAANLGSAIAIK